MDKPFNDKLLIESLKKASSPDNRISCTKARELAERFKVPVSEIGRLADEFKIKITECELGCF